jgi:hypothetical protein
MPAVSGHFLSSPNLLRDFEMEVQAFFPDLNQRQSVNPFWRCGRNGRKSIPCNPDMAEWQTSLGMTPLFFPTPQPPRVALLGFALLIKCCTVCLSKSPEVANLFYWSEREQK